MTTKKDHLRKKSTEPEAIAPGAEAAPEPTIEVPSAAMAETEAVDAAEAEEVAEEVAQSGDEDEEEDESEEESGDESETEIEAEDGPEPEGDAKAEDEDEPEFNPKPRPPAKLERLQKILAAAGVASRRSAEAMIEQGRVQVNGAVVTELGTKADAGRDHIRVDGKLLQGAERLRYFVLNKPKGFVTTVKDPEGRPTVMQFFDKMRERLYPVGRLDYMSEGLLLVTNDGDLANRLTKASSGVEKTYLVKVAGQPTEDELDILRGGVSIERGKPGEGRVRTSPARIRQVRQGDNPWYEVILIEGRNRELRKMFEEVGHFVEKIRRVGYGPLVLDQEPGNLRELEPGEVEALRKVAEGKLRTPKSKELRRRNLVDAGKLPTVLPKPSRLRPPVKPFTSGPGAERSAPPNFGPDYRPKRAFGTDRPDRPARPASDRGPARPDDRPRRDSGPSRFGSAGSSSRPSARPYPSPDARAASRPAWKKDDRPARPAAPFTPGGSGEDRPRPAWKKDDRPARPAAPFTPGGGGEDRPRPSFPRAGGAGAGRTGGGRTFGAKPAWNKSGSSDRPAFKRPDAPRREAPIHDEDSEPVRPPNLHIEELPQSDRSNFSRPSSSRPPSGRPGAPRFSSDRPSAPRYSSDRPGADRPRPERPPSDRPSGGKPFRSESGLARPFTTSSGKPRAGGARPSSKPGKPGGSRPYGAGTGARSSSGPRAGSDSRPSYGSGSGGKRPYESRSTGRPSAGSGSRSDGPARPYTPRTEPTSDYRPTEARPYPPSSSRAERKAGPGWKPKSNFGGAGKSPSGARSGPRPGGPSKSGYKPSGPRSGGARPGGPRPGGPRPGGPRSGGPRPGGASGGKRRG